MCFPLLKFTPLLNVLVTDRRVHESIGTQSPMKISTGEIESRKENMKELTVAFTETQANCSDLEAWQSASRCGTFWRLECSHPANDDPVVVPRDG